MTTTVHINQTTPQAPVVPSAGALRPLGQTEVRITGGFWGDRQQVNACNTIQHIGSRLESEGWLHNFDLAARGRLPHGRRGREFSDSEVYKYLEALAWEIGRSDTPELDCEFRRVVARVEAAQESDGYLNTMFGRPGQQPRWTDLEWGHELYCLGHLFQAAVARERTRPGSDDGLLRIACRAADLVCQEFGADGRDKICGHAEIEVGLAELARATGDARYLAQARLFVERHGRGTLADIEWGRRYFQDDQTVRGATVLRGHAVRANYLAAGSVDVAVDTEDPQLLDALKVQWDTTVARRTYLTGGQGSHHQDEAFGEDWELPPDRAYSETCAGIGSIMFSWRLLLQSGDSRHADLIERTLFNVVATSPSADGRTFYYTNTLHQRVPGTPADPDATSPRASSSLRAPWFDVSCCPPNVARTLASLDAYVATADDEGVQLHQYAPAEVRTTLADGRVVSFTVRTRYPATGEVTVRINETAGAEWTLSMRIPDWAGDATLQAPESSSLQVGPGMARIRRSFVEGDVVTLRLPLHPRLTFPDSRIDAIRGSIAVERGPEVLALESVDTESAGLSGVSDVAIAAGTTPFERDGRTWITLASRRSTDAPSWPYTSSRATSEGSQVDVPLVEYHAWAQRGPSTMRVWIPDL